MVIVIYSALWIGLLLSAMLLPYLPGRFDPMAVPLSVAATAMAFGGVLQVPIGLAWLIASRRGFAAAKVRSRSVPCILTTTPEPWASSAIDTSQTSDAHEALGSFASATFGSFAAMLTCVPTRSTMSYFMAKPTTMAASDALSLWSRSSQRSIPDVAICSA